MEIIVHMNNLKEGRWLLLIHQIPPKPNYFRVKIWRRLQRLGAVAIKNSVYVLPNSDQAQEDFQWLLREIMEGGGEATLCEARFIEGLTYEQVEALFHVARDADYSQIAEEARNIIITIPAVQQLDYGRRAQIGSDLARLKRRIAEVVAIDFFGAPGREAAEKSLEELEAYVHDLGHRKAGAISSRLRIEDLQGRTWVTRKGIQIDRIASAWLIRHFIDQEACFKFVSPMGYRPGSSDLRFDMFEAEFTHEGDKCTFEVLIERLGIDDPALRPIAEIVHNIDTKDSRFNREETDGINSIITGITMAYKEDKARLIRGLSLFDDLYECFRSR